MNRDDPLFREYMDGLKARADLHRLADTLSAPGELYATITDGELVGFIAGLGVE